MTVSVVGGLALALVAAQLVATACLQGRQRGRGLNMPDLLGILPGWTFFVQPASEFDVTVDVRWYLAGAATGGWRETATAVARQPWHWLWRPAAFGDGALWLAIGALDRRHASGPGADAGSSLAYATLLAFARAQVPDGPSDGIQFALVRIAGTAREVRFVSDVHPC